MFDHSFMFTVSTMTARNSNLTHLLVGVAGLGLVACGPSQKGDGEPITQTTVRQALVGNSKALAADLSRTAKFLETSSLFQSGASFVQVDTAPTECVANPDGSRLCEPVEPAEPEPIDLDVNDEADQLAQLLEERILVDANVESQTDTSITYLLDGATVCASGSEPADPDCVSQVDDAEIRLVVTSPAAGNVDVDILIGPNRANPLSLEVHQDLLAAEADLGGIKGAAAHLSTISGEPLDLPSTFEGRARVELSAPTDTQIKGSVSVLQPIKVADGDFSLSLAQSLPLYALTLDGAAETLLGEMNAGAIDGLFPVTSYVWDETTGTETESSYDLGFHIGGATGTMLLDAATEALAITGLGLGDTTTTFSVDGNEVVAIDLNPADGRTIDLDIASPSEDVVTVEVSPKLDLSIAMKFAAAAAVLGEVDDWMLDDVLRIKLDGAAKPAVQMAGEQMEVLDGTLTMSLDNAGITHTVSAGQCLLDDGAAEPTPVEPDGGTTPDGEPGEYNPLNDFIVGACL